jgi:hypothetical protein
VCVLTIDVCGPSPGNTLLAAVVLRGLEEHAGSDVVLKGR